MNTDFEIASLGPEAPEALAELEDLVLQRLGARLVNFRLSTRDAGLVLRGRTLSQHAKQLALHALMEIPRAPITANEIEVRCSS